MEDKVQDKMKSIGDTIFWVIFILGPTGIMHASTRFHEIESISHFFANVYFHFSPLWGHYGENSKEIYCMNFPDE